MLLEPSGPELYTFKNLFKVKKKNQKAPLFCVFIAAQTTYT